MIKQSEYLPKQMNGPVICAYMEQMDNQLKDADTIEQYLHNLSIANAQEAELESIGCIVGYPRPLVPEGFNEENLLILTTLPLYQEASIGLSEVNSEIGGRLSSLQASQTGYMELNMYRSFLDKVAYIKRYGITMYAVDKIASLISDDYELGWNENEDVTLNFNQPIGFKNLWLLSQLFLKLATAPQIIVSSESE